MTTTRINHTGHNHPNTTAARTLCRKAFRTETVPSITVPLATVGNGKASHVAELDNGQVIGVRCGAGLGRGVRGNSTFRFMDLGAIEDVTCTKCRTHN